MTASQAGNASYVAAADVTRTVAAQRATTTVSVVPDPSQSSYSHPMTFTVTVTSPGGIPTGTVTLSGGSPNQSITATLDALGTTQITSTNLVVVFLLGPVPHGTIFTGTDPLRFTYNGDANFNTDWEETSHTVYPAPTEVDVTSNINPSAQGQLVTFTVTISTIAPGIGIPPGTVVLYDGATPISGVLTLTNGVATFSTSALTYGAHSISAQYTSTSNNYATSNNTALPYTHNERRATTTVLTSNNNASDYGEDVTFTANVTSTTPGTLTGTVKFYDGATLLNTGTLSGGVVSFTTNALIVGTHPITAVYSGDGFYATSTSAVLNQVVNQAVLTVTA
ncbi:MAG: Ig-like domain repeat protein, partial [Rhodoferax sp.]|nr:Ig-like domain repeat protein [Rhodoferax sp.]